MPIIDLKGRPRSVRTHAEEVALLSEDIGRLSMEEQRTLLEMYEQLQAGDSEDYDAVARIEYETAPVDVKTYLTDPYFLGETGSSLWPRLVDDMIEMFEGQYNEVALGGSFGWGKTFWATTAMSYVLYQMSCLREPQKAYGIDKGSHIYLAMLSVTEKTARRVVINEFIGKVVHSRYFKEKFPPQAAPSLLEIRFPKQIQVIAGSTGSSAIIGLNAFAGFIDETSFMGETKEVDRSGKIISIDRGEKIYQSILRRMKSRFMDVGRLPGVMILASSKERPIAFVETRIQQAREQADPTFFVREYATWDVKPAEDFTGETFKVAAGSDQTRSRILSGDPEEEAKLRDVGLQIVEVPIEYKLDFERDLEGSLRDIAGVATMSVSPYMQRTEKIIDAQDDMLPNPCAAMEGGDPIEEWVAGTPLHIHWGMIAKAQERRIPGGYSETFWRPLRRPEAPRYVHVDASLTGDATGLVIAHIAGWVEVIRRDATGNEYTELAPMIETDLILRIVPPPGDEILLSDVRSIVYQFIDHGFNIRFGSMDQYQSADMLQQFRKRGIEAELVSVDRTTEPYDVLKTCTYEDRLRMHAHAHCAREMGQLQRVPRKGNTKGFKIDHPKVGSDGRPGSKDISDALAAVVFNLTQRTPGQPVPPMLGVSDGPVVEQVDHSWVTDGKTVIVTQESGRRDQSGSIVGTRPADPNAAPMPFIKG